MRQTTPFHITFLAFLLCCVFTNGAFAEQIWQGIPEKNIRLKASFAADRLNAMRFVFSEDKTRLEISLAHKTEFGSTKYEVKHGFQVDSSNGLEQLFDNLPQFPGEYEITISGKGASCTVSLEHPAAIDPISFGEEPGELLIENAGNSSITAHSEKINIKHPGFKDSMRRGISTPDGNMIFRLPAGYWSLERSSTPSEIVQLIPVHSGKRTVISWSVIPQISIDSDAGAKVNRLEIREVQSDQQGNATLRFALPAGLSRQAPILDDLKISENSRKGQIIELQESSTPLHLVLLLDSSGSMKKDMKKAIDSTIKFIEMLPENAHVEVIDFDTKPKPIKASNRDELIKAVKAIKADGATALRDSIIMGIDKLKGSVRPALVVFTDGFDFNYNDTAPGSKATEKEMIARVSESRVPVFSIGFGDGADEATLSRIADISGGAYQAANSANLDTVFASLKETVAREYLLKWTRPNRSGHGMKPVVSIVIDTSGSMSDSIEKGKPGERFEMAKFALHGMVKKLPDNTLVQIVDFDDKINITQTLTADRARMHKGIAAFKRGGGTDVTAALKASLEGLLAAPSNRRYLFFLTDAAIKQSGKEKLKFERLLDRLRDENVFSMWLGMVDDPEFQKVADRSGGVAVISKNFASLQQTLDDLLGRISQQEEAKSSAIELVWRMPVENALPQPVSGTDICELSPMPVSEENRLEAKDSLAIRIVDTSENSAINEAIGAGQTAPAESKKTSATAATGQSDKARLSIPADINADNQACRLHVTGIDLFNSLNGVNTPKDTVFAVVSLRMQNILPEQEVTVYPNGGSHPSRWINRKDTGAKVIKAIPPYLIKDLRQHLFLRWNDQIVPVSPATWLLEDSLMPFSSYSVRVMPDQNIEGKVVFLVADNKGLTSGSLDFYDTAYGHASLNLAGTPVDQHIKVTALPQKIIGKLSEAFSLEVQAISDMSAPLAGATAGQHLVYRLIDFVIDSKLQALLDLNPAQRMHLTINTDKGPVRRPVSAATALLPGGFFTQARLAPGSANHLRQAFLLPAQLASSSKGILYIDMKGEDVAISLDSSSLPTVNAQWDAEGNGLKVRINSIERTTNRSGYSGEWLFVDSTVADELDGSATRLKKLFFLGRADLKNEGFKTSARAVKVSENKAGKKGIGTFSENSESDGNAIRIYPDKINEKLMFGANDQAIVPDGQQLRFITVFKLPKKGDYMLAVENPEFAKNLPQTSESSIPEWMLAINDEVIPTLPDSFEKLLSSRLKQLAPARKQLPTPETVDVADETGATTSRTEHLHPPFLAPGNVFPASVKQKLVLTIEAEPSSDNAVAQTGKAAAALSGGSNSKRSFTLLSEDLPANISETPFEIAYVNVKGDEGAAEIKAMISGPALEITGKTGINLKLWKPVREIIKISGSSYSFPVFERNISDCDLTSRIHSVALGLPDLDKDSETELANRWQELKPETPPDHISIWRWYAHARIARFIADQTRFEQNKSEILTVALNRDKKPRLMVLTGIAGAGENNFESRLDLLSVMPDVSGSEEACRAFRIANGMFLSDLEAQVMQGKGVFQFWGRNNVHFIAPSGKQKNAWLKFAAARGVSENVIDTIKKSKSVIMFPENPAIVNEKPFWSWMEIDPKTYEMIGVLETGERGTIAGEAIIQALIPDGAGLMLGYMKGIETAVWGQCAFILEGCSYEEALDKTEMLIGYLGEKLGEIGDSYDVPVGDAKVDLISGKWSLQGFSSDGTYSPWEGYKSFGSGFEMGAAYYLAKARAAGKK